MFGLLTLIAYVIGGKGEDQAYQQRSAERLATRSEVDVDQAKQMSSFKLDLAAGAAKLSSQKPVASTKAVPGSPTHDKLMAEMAAKADAEAAANSDASAVKLVLTATNSAKGEPPLQYVEKELSVPAGASVELTFSNPDVQMHNVVICKIGKSDGVVALALAMAADPEAMAKGYIPESEDIIVASKLLTVGQREVVKFTAPAEPGDYPYVCTFPGHAALMHGILKVTPASAGGATTAAGPAAQQLVLTATNSAKGEPPLQYVEKELTASAGSPIELTFKNPDVQMHNVVICKIGKADGVVALATAMAADPEGMAKGYIPESEDIIAASKLLTIGQRDVVKFTAPSEPGDYPYVCTFPGHAILMKGVLKITPAK